MIIRMGYNEYLITPDKLEIEIFFKGEPVGLVNVKDVENGAYDELIDAHFDELSEIINTRL